MKHFRLPKLNNDLQPLVEKNRKRYSKVFRHPTFRPSQLESITLIGQLIDDGVKNIVLSAPTGSGKSDIAMTICDAYKQEKEWSFGMLSTQLNLMKQYKDDFPELKELKGRGNFRCDIEPCSAAEAPCAKQKNFKCSVDVFDEGKRVRNCEYFIQKRQAFEAPGYISTPWYVFLETAFSFSKFRGRDIIVFDEAHNIENIMVEQLQERWTMRNHAFLFSDREMLFPTYAEAWSKTADDEIAWKLYFLEVVKAAKRKIKTIKESKQAGRKNEEYNELLLAVYELREKAKKLLKLLEHPYSLLAEVSSNRYGKVATFKPLSVREYAPEIFDRISNVRIFMSATINGKLFADSLGLDRKSCAFIEMEKSNFPIQSRKVFHKNVSRLDYQTRYRKSVPKLGEFIRERMNKHLGENAMVYAPSYELCHKLAEYLKPYHSMILTHDDKTKNAAFKKFLEGPEKGYLLITPSMTEGYDLRDDICRLLIVVKIPYGNIGDALVSRRMFLHEKEWRDKYEGSAMCPYEPPKGGVLCGNYACHKPCQEHYRAQAAYKLVQVIGRGVRNEEDYCETWIVDSGWKGFYRTVLPVLPEWFKESLEEIA